MVTGFNVDDMPSIVDDWQVKESRTPAKHPKEKVRVHLPLVVQAKISLQVLVVL
jgi:hypothetical protein